MGGLDATVVGGIRCAIGAFHAYAHGPPCHRKFSVSYQRGFGLVDGEVMERIWSLLRQHFGATTQMISANRSDHLSLVVNRVREKVQEKLPGP